MCQVKETAREGVIRKRWRDTINCRSKGCLLEYKSDLIKQHSTSVAVLGKTEKKFTQLGLERGV